MKAENETTKMMMNLKEIRNIVEHERSLEKMRMTQNALNKKAKEGSNEFDRGYFFLMKDDPQIQAQIKKIKNFDFKDLKQEPPFQNGRRSRQGETVTGVFQSTLRIIKMGYQRGRTNGSGGLARSVPTNQRLQGKEEVPLDLMIQGNSRENPIENEPSRKHVPNKIIMRSFNMSGGFKRITANPVSEETIKKTIRLQGQLTSISQVPNAKARVQSDATTPKGKQQMSGNGQSKFQMKIKRKILEWQPLDKE